MRDFMPLRLLTIAASLALTFSLIGSALAAPAPRPNVVIILADDMGFSDLGCYGGEIRTPHIDAMAQQGVRFAQFYNMARCCPTRASLLTGLYPHEAGIGAMNQPLDHKPAYQGELNNKCVTIAEVLRTAGYHTAMVGKWHLCHLTIAHLPQAQAKSMLDFQVDGPISESMANWPCNRGFEEHWGTIPGVEDYYDPYGLVHNETPIHPDTPNFYYTDFITDYSVKMIDNYAGQPAPFFLYVAYTAPHWPLQAREQDIEHYATTYNVGWDAIRLARFQRQIAMGLVDKDWGLSPRAFNPALNDGESRVGPWTDAPAKAWQARRMAVYAAMIENLDRGVGKILDEISTRGIDQNTLVIFLSDNGACQEQVQPDWYDIPLNMRDGAPIAVGNRSSHMPGPEDVWQSYGPAWANASNTPFRKFKHFTEEGGIATPFIVRWPAAVKEGGRIETTQVGDVIDLMPSILDLAGAQYPRTFKNNPIVPEEGIDLVPVMEGAPPIPRGALCWEHEGNRAVRIGNWKLVAPHGERWQLFDMINDRTELHDVSADHPEIVAELHHAYDAWVKRCGVEEWPIPD
jgi:arylsulfatase A-like enzyme